MENKLMMFSAGMSIDFFRNVYLAASLNWHSAKAMQIYGTWHCWVCANGTEPYGVGIWPRMLFRGEQGYAATEHLAQLHHNRKSWTLFSLCVTVLWFLFSPKSVYNVLISGPHPGLHFSSPAETQLEL